MHSLEPQITFYVGYFGMWFSALVIFPLEVTNSGHHGNQEWLIHLRFHPNVITNPPQSL